MDKRSYPVLLPFKVISRILLVSMEVPRTAEVSLEILDLEHNSLRSLLNEEQEAGEVRYELDLNTLPEKATFIRLSSEGHQVVRRIEA